jgi:hypothetical protein
MKVLGLSGILLHAIAIGMPQFMCPNGAETIKMAVCRHQPEPNMRSVG